MLGTLKRIKADGFSSNILIPDPVLKAVQERGYAWHVWTLNDPEQAKEVLIQAAGSCKSGIDFAAKAHEQALELQQQMEVILNSQQLCGKK